MSLPTRTRKRLVIKVVRTTAGVEVVTQAAVNSVSTTSKSCGKWRWTSRWGEVPSVLREEAAKTKVLYQKLPLSTLARSCGRS